MLRLMDRLDDHDDVQNVYANFDIEETRARGRRGLAGPGREDALPAARLAQEHPDVPSVQALELLLPDRPGRRAIPPRSRGRKAGNLAAAAATRLTAYA